ncbi:PH domain-containing protein [Thalassobellus suaedae]|uniref:PH domain-containing protein n=1 Tax=Thalassobellus suaedae TaxID=3074124 RepID=A0ABY9Y0R0_9FLAO|nr:PH domain-containing protein [Flavobacteriaceae bacterium HL-DH10]
MKTYKSKFGYKIMVFLALLFCSIIGFMVYKNESLKAIILVGGIFSLVYGLFLYLNLSTEYTLTNDGVLKVKYGFFYNKRFDISKIKTIAKTNNLISSPAPSLDRIELTYGEFDLIIISPKDKIGFAQELTKVNPKIVNKLTE